MNVADVLAALRSAGVEIRATAEGNLRWSSPRPLQEGLRAALRGHKPRLLALLLVAEAAVEAKDRHGWSTDSALRQRQWEAADAIDDAFLAGDLPRLRVAVQSFLRVIRPAEALSPFAAWARG